MLIAFVAPALASCGTSEPARVSQSVITDSAGVTIATGPASDVPLDWSLTELFRIGGADSGAGSFSHVDAQHASTDAAGNIYVLDRKQHRVEVFDSTGAHVRFIGARGGGPGEFQDAASMLVLPAGDVGVVDYGKQALVRWRADGSALPEFAFADFFPTHPLWQSGDTLVFVHVVGSERERSYALRLRTSADTFTTPALVLPTSGMVRFSCIGLNLPPMFAPRFVWTGNGQRQALTHQVPYRIDIYEGGRLARSLRRDIPPVTPDASHVAKLHPDGGMKIQYDAGACTVPVNELMDRQGVASQLPMLEALRFDNEGRLWAQRYGIRDEPRSVDVFEANGEYRGTLANKSVPLGFIGSDRVLFAESDPETDLMYIVAYRVSSASRSR